mgnify:CR=1 FL=1
MEDNILTFNNNPMLQAEIVNPKLLVLIRKQEQEEKKRIEAAIKQLEKEKGAKYPQ